MKIGLAIAPEQASPSAFVVFRDRLETSMAKATALGYDGVELALSDAAQAEPDRIRRALAATSLELPAISTGRVFAERKVWFTHPEDSIRREAVETICGLVDVAAAFGSLVNIGRARGYVHEADSQATATERFLACMAQCAQHAARRGILLVLEPVNRYETNFINSVPQALAMIDRLGEPNVKVMPDVFHMNIEDVSIEGSFRQAGARVGYVHLADSNRLAPGQGHLPFTDILAVLAEIGYDGWVTAEILPAPDPDTAASAAIAFLRPILPASHPRQPTPKGGTSDS